MRPRVTARRGSDIALSSNDGNKILPSQQEASQPAIFAASSNEDQLANGLTLVTVLGQGRVDHFSTSARETTARENFLLDYYVSGVLAFHRSRFNASFHPPRDVCISVIVRSAACMDTMFAYSSGHIAKRTGSPDTEARIYGLSAVQRINEALSDPSQRFLDATIMAVLGFINMIFEINDGNPSPEQQQELDTHIQGLRILLHGRGGFASLCSGSPLSWILAYTDIRAFGEISAGWTTISAHGSLPLAPRLAVFENGSDSTSGNYIYPFQWLVEEYAGALQNFFHEAVRRRNQTRVLSESDDGGGSLSISRIFSNGTPVHRLLTDPNCVVNNPRIAVLLLLHSILWDHRDTLQSAFDYYFKIIRIRMVDEGLDSGGSIDQFIWILITNPTSKRIECMERVFLLARLLRIHFKLSKHLQFQVEDALLHLLISEDVAWEAGFEPDVLHFQITRDLGFSDQLPP
jgi:hypothetical protein